MSCGASSNEHAPARARECRGPRDPRERDAVQHAARPAGAIDARAWARSAPTPGALHISGNNPEPRGVHPPMTEASGSTILVRGTIGAAVIYAIDAWVVGQGALATLVGIGACLVALVRAGLALQTRRRRQALAYLGMIGVWVFTVALTVVSVRYQWSRAQARAETVVAACQAYKAAHGDYPPDLEALVPSYLPSVPRAKYTLLLGGFHYSHHPGRTMLMYTALPPFMHTSYDFEADRWVTLD
jgi:hypothetical protein